MRCFLTHRHPSLSAKISVYDNSTLGRECGSGCRAQRHISPDRRRDLAHFSHSSLLFHSSSSSIILFFSFFLSLSLSLCCERLSGFAQSTIETSLSWQCINSIHPPHNSWERVGDEKVGMMEAKTACICKSIHHPLMLLRKKRHIFHLGHSGREMNHLTARFSSTGIILREKQHEREERTVDRE